MIPQGPGAKLARGAGARTLGQGAQEAADGSAGLIPQGPGTKPARGPGWALKQSPGARGRRPTRA